MSLQSWVRRLFSAKQLYECLQPLFFVTYMQGLTPFFISQDNEGNKKLTPSIFGYMNAIVHVAVYAVCYILTLMNNCESVVGYFFRTRISYFGDLLQILSGFIGISVIYLSAIIPKHRLQKVLTIIHTMDVQLKDVGVKIMYSKIIRFSYAVLFSIIVVNITSTMGSFELIKSVEIRPSFSLYVTFVLQHSVVSIAISLFTCITKTLELRFSMLNKVRKK